LVASPQSRTKNIAAKDKRMNAMSESRVRVGLIIPSSNTFSEAQFNHFAPAGLGFHVTRARIAGEWKRPLSEMASEIATAAKLLSDCEPSLIVFHCTETSMTQGPRGEGKILDIVHDATGIEAMATSRLVLEALQGLGIKKVVLLTPYKSNKNVIDYLNSSGIGVVRDVAMGLDFSAVAGRARLAEGAYIAAQIRDSLYSVWDWQDWVYDPSNGSIVARDDRSAPLPYNYFVFGISRMS